MPHYHYICKKCHKGAERDFGRELSDSEILEWAVYETAHPMNPTAEELKEALVCPRCGSTKAEKTLIGANITIYEAGRGYKDRVGLNRDMNYYHLTQKDDNGESLDPYKEMREPGEADDLALRLRRGSYKPTGAKQVYDPKTRQWIDTATGLPVPTESKMKY